MATAAAAFALSVLVSGGTAASAQGTTAVADDVGTVVSTDPSYSANDFTWT